jgi:hypothetical protein
MSALPPKADIAERDRQVRFGPKGDIRLLRFYIHLLLDDDRQRERKSRALPGL